MTVHIEAVTETRTFPAGIRLDGRQPGLAVRRRPRRSVLLTLYGSTADLDRLGSSPIVISLNVADLEPGRQPRSPVVPSLPSAVTVAAISPETVTVTVAERPTPTPVPTPRPPVESGVPIAPVP